MLIHNYGSICDLKKIKKIAKKKSLYIIEDVSEVYFLNKIIILWATAAGIIAKRL